MACSETEGVGIPHGEHTTASACSTAIPGPVPHGETVISGTQDGNSFFFLIYFIYLFFGRIGSSLLRAGFL